MGLDLTFSNITKMDDITVYTNKIDTFKQYLNLFHKVWGRSCFTKDENNIGGEEIFYIHYLKFYMPMLAEVTLDRHKMGLGLFRIQGFEGKNKEPKKL